MTRHSPAYAGRLPVVGRHARSGADIARAVADPLLIVISYAVVQSLFHADIGVHGLVLMLLTASLTYPGTLRYTKHNPHLVSRVFWHWTVTALVLLAFGAGTDTLRQFDPQALAVWFVAAPGVVIGAHAVAPSLAPYLRTLRESRKVVVVGLTEVGLRLATAIEAGEAGGQQVVGFFDDRTSRRVTDRGTTTVLGRLDDVADYAKANSIGVIYIALPMASQPRILDLLEALRDTTASIHFVPDIFVADLIQARVSTVAGLPLVAVCESPFHGLTAAAKRLMDLLLVAPALPLVLPAMALIAALIRLTSPGPAIFKQRRYGLDGDEIMVWKFRSMRVLEDGASTYTQVTRDDDRVTPLGRLLRRTSLDELPQLLNVLGGSMSLVGPRPHAVAVNEQYRKVIPGYMVRHKVKPGITGWAQVNGYRGGDDLESMRKRIEHDLDYLRFWSLGLDCRIVWMTIVMLVRGDSKAF